MVFGLLHKKTLRHVYNIVYAHKNTANEHRKIYDYHMEYAKTKTLFAKLHVVVHCLKTFI